MAKIIVFDIDGTLANTDHRKKWVATKPKNWAAWNAAMADDALHADIAELAISFHTQGNTVLLCSGRGEETRAVTESWLAQHVIPHRRLYMRRERDYRKDSIIKVELLAQIREDFGEPWLWFDDRQQVVDAIRAEGVRVLQVAPGDF